jgi:hypothetical protein
MLHLRKQISSYRIPIRTKRLTTYDNRLSRLLVTEASGSFHHFQKSVGMFNPLAHPICFSRPLRVYPGGKICYVPLAMFLVDVLRPKVIVELGAREGAMFTAYSQAIKELRLDAICYGIDEWEAGLPSAPEDGEPESLQSHHALFFADISRLISNPAEAAVGHFGDRTIDLLHIDSCETYVGAKRTLEQWLPKMSAQGLILLSKVNSRREGHGVWKLWDELKQRYTHFQFTEEGGLGLFLAGEAVPPAATQIFPTSDRDAAIVREFFQHQGRRLTLQFQKDQLSRDLKGS